MKKFLIILLSLTLALGMFTACGGGSKTSTVTLVGENDTYAEFLGTVEIVGTNGATTGEFKKGETITLKYTPANGTEILSWAIGDDTLGDTEEITYTVGSKDVTITVLEGNINKTVQNVVFEDCTVAYNRGNAVPDVQYDALDTAETVTYEVKKDGVVIGNTATEVGTYEVTVIIEAEGYEPFRKTITVTIGMGTLNIDLVDTRVQYDPAATKAINVINAFEGVDYTITYADANGNAVEAPQNAGVYTATLTASCANYNDKTATATLTIEKLNGIITVPDVMEVDVGTVITAANLNNITLNNNEQTLDIKIVNNAGVEVAEAKDNGVYQVIVNAAASANYNAAVEKRFYINISEQGGGSTDGIGPTSRTEFEDLVKDAVFEGATVTYNGMEQNITTITGMENYPYAYTVAYKGNFGINAGTYQASAYITDKATGFSKELKTSLVIEKADLTISAGNYEDVVQGSQLPDIMSDVTYDGLCGDDTAASLGGRLILSYDFDRKSHHSETPYEIRISGYTSNNYNITYVNGSYEIVLPTYTPTAWNEVSDKLTPEDTENVVYGLQYNGDVTSLTTLNGQEFYGMGVNFFSMMGWAAPGKNFDTSVPVATIELFGQYNVRAFRFSLMPFYARDYGAFTDYYGSYIQYLDECVNACERNGVGMIPSFFWTSAVQDLYDEGRAVALRDDTSISWQFMAEYTAFIVDRYKDSPALFMWEFGNEYNLACEINVDPASLPSWSKRECRTNEEDRMTAQTMNTVYQNWVKVIYDNDPSHRLIGNGDAVYRSGQNGQAYTNASSGGDSLEEQYHIASVLNPTTATGDMNAISWHVYAGESSNSQGSSHIAGYYTNKIPIETWKDYMTHMMTMGKSMNKTCYFGECGTGADGVIGIVDPDLNPKNRTYVDQKRVIDALGDAMMETHFPLALLWNYDPVGYLTPDRTDEHSLGTEWSWCIEDGNDKGFFFMTSLKETNDAIDNGAATATRVEEPVRA